MSTANSDAALVSAARAGKRDAFATLLERHWPLLTAVCRRMLADADLAQDAAQEAAVQAHLSLDRLRRPERFGSWLAGIGLNVCRMWLRERPAESWSWEALQGGRRVLEPIDWSVGPELLAEEADLAGRVRRAVDHLPRGQRAAVLLFYLGGLTYAETAAQLGIGVGAVRTRLHKARTALRRRLWKVWMEERMGAEDAETQLVEMRVTDVRKWPEQPDKPIRHIIVLEEVGGPRNLLIWVGPFEGAAIAWQLEGAETPRPLTYAFTAGVLRAASGRLREVRITRLSEETFYATAIVEGADGTAEVDARPSDAIALALMLDAPIGVHPAVLAADETSLEGAATYATRLAGLREQSGGPAEIVAEAKEKWWQRPPRGGEAAQPPSSEPPGA